VTTIDAQHLTTREYFCSESEFSRAVLAADDVYCVIHQYRKSLVLSWVGGLCFAPDATALEVGCGASLTAIELAERGLRVEATDAVRAMVDDAQREVLAAGVADLVRVSQGDARQLKFADESFDLAVAMGVIPWLRAPGTALGEIARVLKPGGVLVVNCDNSGRLDYSIDPLWNPHFAALRRNVAKAVPAAWVTATRARVYQHSIEEFDRMLAGAGLRKERGKTMGFGPFTVFNHAIVPRRIEAGLHRRLQRAADRGSPFFAGRGAQYLVAARKA
jgi:ubiquinone/menaquinone biosynthesis C-methylase UbiE